MKITEDYLRRRNACLKQTNLFVETFPDGAEITLDNLLTAAKAELDVDWLARRALSGPARAAYAEAKAAARAACHRAMAPARAAYDEAMAPARAAYEEATAPARAAYDEATARAFWDAWQVQKEQSK